MHFATAELSLYGDDAAIFVVDYQKASDLLPDPLRHILSQTGSHVFTAEMLRQYAPTLHGFDQARAGLGDFALFFEPPSLDERITNQFAVFSMMSNPQFAFQEWLGTVPELGRKLVIDAGLKWEIRDKLDQANVTERVLFPGLDGLSRWLARHYMVPEGVHLRVRDESWSTQHEIPPTTD